ncbi:hypothetical protein E5K00_11195 [Hymenobacter aquaticus]|uniref:NTF2 fold domain-containing protein n=1 Tax=Hymenobacter aquaticus TaxID=1867101 RepID=A0A4Z0Q7P3_9BACT|nr:hypothetical protein [Hymenobacter aquaticus]TGE25725.1 hypothetical protein E5K00_11195 [Hymenobacter aquaticus]
MLKALSCLLIGALCATSCQQTPGNDTSMLPTSAETMTDTGAATADGARSAVRRYVQELPNGNLFVLDSATALEVDDHWQVLVPRTDWAGRMPNKAGFEVDKKTGAVKTLMVK